MRRIEIKKKLSIKPIGFIMPIPVFAKLESLNKNCDFYYPV